MFGLGMNNNGTGLVLASMALADHPRVMLPIIFYNLVQHLVAGVVDQLFCRTPTSSSTPQETLHAYRMDDRAVPGRRPLGASDRSRACDEAESRFASRSA